MLNGGMATFSLLTILIRGCQWKPTQKKCAWDAATVRKHPKEDAAYGLPPQKGRPLLSEVANAGVASYQWQFQ